MASGSVSEVDLLSDRFLEQFEIRSEVYGDDRGVDSDRQDGVLVDWDLLDRRFSDDPGFRVWVSRKAAGSDAHLGRNHSLRSGTASLLRAGRETSTLKPLIDRPLQRRSSHNSPGCSQPRKSSNIVPRDSYEHGHRNRSTRDSILKPPWYYGKLGSVESHMTQFAIVAQRNHWDDGEKADYLMCSLTGKASNILKDLPENPSYEDVVTCLRPHYGSVDQVEAYRAQLKNRRRRPGESLQDLMNDIRRIFLSAYPGLTNYMSEIALKDAFITALVDRDLMIKTMEREPKTLDEAYKVTERMELYRSIPETSEGDARSKYQHKVRGAAADDCVLKSLVEAQKVIQRQLSSLQECVNQPPPRAVPSPAGKSRVSRQSIVCHHCQSPGHIRPNCPELAFRPDSSGGNGNRMFNEAARSSDGSRPTDTVRSIGKTLYLKVQIGKRRLKGLLDSGSEVTLLRQQKATD